MFHNILVPLDGSPLAEQALAPALELAGLSGAKVTLFRSFVVPGLVPGERPDYLREVEQKLVGEYFEGLGLKEVETVQAEGEPAEMILEALERLGVDLVVMSTHGRSGLGRWLLGSVAEKVVRHAPCKVMLVRSTD